MSHILQVLFTGSPAFRTSWKHPPTSRKFHIRVRATKVYMGLEVELRWFLTSTLERGESAV